MYIDDPELDPNIPYAEIVLKGEGAYPKLIFDRREIILPVVPLNIESKCVFHIINCGYDNLNLKHKIIEDIAEFHLQLNFVHGKNVSITTNKLRVEAVFSHKKPLSFTTRIEFYDDGGQIYKIPISGTTDNCLFTNFPYM
jgi:hypothetical protein